MLYHAALVRTDVSEEHIASIIRVTGIGELITTLTISEGMVAFISVNYESLLLPPKNFRT
jgi:hypothetical protein